MGVLRLPQVNHLVVLGVGETGVQPVGILLFTGKDMAEHGYRGIAFPAEEPVDGSWHVDNRVRPWSPEYKSEDVQATSVSCSREAPRADVSECRSRAWRLRGVN